MKITDLKTIRFKTTSRRYRSRWGYSFYPREMLKTNPYEVTITLTELLTDTGVSGYWFGRPNEEDSAGTMRWLKELLVGENPFDREKLWHWSHENNSLVDMLLWDFAGRYLNQPVHKLLGGYMDKVKCYASSYPNIGTPEEFADHAEACVKKGYTAYKIHPYICYDPIKMKPAPWSPAFPKQDVEVCKAVREQVGDDIVLMLDPAHMYNFEEALYVGKEIEKLNFFWFESPMPEGGRRGGGIEPYIRLCEALDVPVCAPEVVRNLPYSRTEWIVRAACDMGRTEVRYNGITGCKKTINLYESFGMRATIHGRGRDWGNIQICASTDIDTFEYYERGLLAPGLDEEREKPPPYLKELSDPMDENGYVHVPQKPGLGFEINWDYIEENRVDK